ncbi:hypothetical protein JQ628_03585 [Bradyrhizobium lablabi]|nr:hypothetical protein [Bradyrhizobium lablabi]MBR1120587.1 hypothetical protein [Bradyrhizobium lablabi]
MTRIFGAALSSLFAVGLTVVSSARAGSDAIESRIVTAQISFAFDRHMT